MRREPYEFVDDRLAIDLLLGVEWLREALDEDVPLEALEQRWQSDLDAFAERRGPLLLYSD